MISSGRNGHFRSCFIFEDFVRWTGEIPVCESKDSVHPMYFIYYYIR